MLGMVVLLAIMTHSLLTFLISLMRGKFSSIITKPPLDTLVEKYTHVGQWCSHNSINLILVRYDDGTRACDANNGEVVLNPLCDCEDEQFCRVVPTTDNVTICWNLKWYCHDPQANAIHDMRNTACHGDNWSTIGCCYGGDNGASCDTATLQAGINESPDSFLWLTISDCLV